MEQVRCPQCGNEVLRIRRRVVDRMLSLVTPVRRYRCSNPLCHWRGTVRTHD